MPDLLASTAYVLLRPFVKPDAHGGWELDSSSPRFHGAAMGAGQELTDEEHPHLKRSAFVPIPAVRPGDAVFWHCDVAHMVEQEHQGKEDASVFYIPTLPLCEINIAYTQRQKSAFLHRSSPPDFPGGSAQTEQVGKDDISSISAGGRAAMGFDSVSVAEATTPGQRLAYDIANEIIVR
jgi:hypothetical protein